MRSKVVSSPSLMLAPTLLVLFSAVQSETVHEKAWEHFGLLNELRAEGCLAGIQRGQLTQITSPKAVPFYHSYMSKNITQTLCSIDPLRTPNNNVFDRASLLLMPLLCQASPARMVLPTTRTPCPCASTADSGGRRGCILRTHTVRRERCRRRRHERV